MRYGRYVRVSGRQVHFGPQAVAEAVCEDMHLVGRAKRRVDRVDLGPRVTQERAGQHEGLHIPKITVAVRAVVK